jgi:hypothetical protein
VGVRFFVNRGNDAWYQGRLWCWCVGVLTVDRVLVCLHMMGNVWEEQLFVACELDVRTRTSLATRKRTSVQDVQNMHGQCSVQIYHFRAVQVDL